MKTRTILKWASAPLLMSGFLLANAAQSQAAVTCVVTHSAPASVNVGESLGVTFSADVSGTPNANHECTIKDLVYSWTATVTGSDGGTATYSGTGPSASISHVANNLCQSYTVSASFSVSYNTSSECQVGGSSVNGSDSAGIEVNATPCS